MAFGLKINELTIEHRNTFCLNNISLGLNRGEIGCLVGESGCGKTTLLRCISGFIPVTHGTISIQDKIVSTSSIHIPPEQRQVGMVFQDFALFPHLTVKKNISFGIQHLPATQQQERLSNMLDLIGLKRYAQRYPHELSGGQQQRVALARSLAPKPKLLLLDEPFSSLDSSLRLKITQSVRQLIKEQETTTLMVSHDQNEALAMADMLGVISDGKLLQWNTPYNVYHEPVSYEVATLIGMSSTLSGKVKDGNHISTILGDAYVDECPTKFKPGDPVYILIRPDDIIHNDDSDLKGTIVEKQFRGAEFLYRLKLDNDESVFCFAPSHHNHSIGESIGIDADIEHTVIFSRGG